MKIIRKSNEKYAIQRVGKTLRIVRVIKEYTSEKEASNDMARLVLGQVTEEELTEED